MSNSKRYRLHRKVRDEGYRVDAYIRTVYTPWNSVTVTDSVRTLMDIYHYSLQTEIV